MEILIDIVPEIDPGRAYAHLQSPEAGGIDMFIGTVRNNARGRAVEALEFEAYGPMAILEMKKIAVRAGERWPLQGLVMLHVVGVKKVGAAVVAVGASSAHRDAAFEACRFLIDELKRTVPIWKREYYPDGSVWVAAHP